MKTISDRKFLIVITGPTAVGKTDLCIKLAKDFNTEIISADSRQFYKELKIGTAVPTPQQLNEVKHHFIQHKSVIDYYNAYKFEEDVINFLNEFYKKNKLIFLTGGSGLYIDAVCNGIDLIPDVDVEIRELMINKYKTEGIDSLRFELKKLDPELYNQIDLKNHQRILRALEVIYQTGKPFSSFRTQIKKSRDFITVKVVLNRERTELHNRINNRVDKMIEEGLLEEVRSLINFKDKYALKTVGYRELFDFIEGKITLDEAIELIKRNTRRYARKQLTWFRKDKSYKWFHPDDYMEIKNYIYKTINQQNMVDARKGV
ncbi:MAG: tRNA (adenosine(37)-N6)-dimethylallyltransferase MiaA [Marinilabiliales bacterium]